MIFSRKPLVFVSYSRKDKEKVNALSGRLASSGVRTWLDTQDIAGGEWRQNIKQGLRHSNFFLSCLSQNTVERGEVLQYEIDSALEIQRERLEGDIYLIPVRLEPCEIPECLRHLQCLDVYEQDGWKRLRRVLRSKIDVRPALAFALALALIVMLVAYIVWRPSARDEFLAVRAQGKSAPKSRTLRLGVTIWKLEPSQGADPPAVRELVHPQTPAGGKGEPADWTPVRLQTGANLGLGDKIQVGIETSREGYLYVINRSSRKDGSVGPASLVFPTSRIHGGDNHIWPGRVIRLPDRDSRPPYWEIASSRPDYAGEVLLVILAPRPLDGVVAQEDALPIDTSRVDEWVRQWGKGVRSVSGESRQLRLTVEEARARDQGVLLTRAEPLPQTILEADGDPDAAVLASVSIPVRASR